MESNKIGTLNLNQADISAILCAIPLVTQIDTDTPTQKLINTASCESATHKLIDHALSFSDDEVRVISCAISAAICVISGSDMADVFDVDDDWKRDLSQHFFALNRLEPIFHNFVDEILHRSR